MTVKVGGLTGFPTGADYHLADQVAMMHTGPLSTRSGVIAGLDLVKTAGMGGAITPGQAWVAGTSGAAQGGYPFTVTADEPITFAPGDATRDRIDLVVARVYENAFDASGQTTGDIEVVQGTYPSSGQPVEPALPANSVRLFAQRINAGTSAGSGGFDTALTTDRREKTVAHGGILPVPDGSDTTTGSEGMYRDRADTDTLERHNGSDWVPVVPTRVEATVTVGPTPVNTAVTAALGPTIASETGEDFSISGFNVIVPVAGLYAITPRVTIPADPTGRCHLNVVAAGVTYRISAALEAIISGTVTVRLAAGATVKFEVFHTAGATHTVSGSVLIARLNP